VARAPAGLPPYPKFTPTSVTVSDQLGENVQVDLIKPKKLCLPANVNGQDPTASAHGQHLVCYAARLSRTTPAQAKLVPTAVSTNNEFGNEVVRAMKLEELCLRSQRTD